MIEGEVPADDRDQRDSRSPRASWPAASARADVVDQAERGDREHPDQDAEVGPVADHATGRRDRDARDDREAADARHRPRVNARAVGGLVERADRDAPTARPAASAARRSRPPTESPRPPCRPGSSASRESGKDMVLFCRKRWRSSRGDGRRPSQGGLDGRCPCYHRIALSKVASPAANFEERIATREARIGIVGLGYAGLPLAMAFAEAGFDVTGIDLDESGSRRSGERRSYLVDVPADRYDGLDGRLHATTDYAAAARRSTRSRSACRRRSRRRARPTSPTSSRRPSRVAQNMRQGQLIVLQSTSHPGTTEEIVLPILERSGGKVGDGLLPRLRAGARRPGQQGAHDPHHAQAGLGRDARVPAPHRAALRTRSSTP